MEAKNHSLVLFPFVLRFDNFSIISIPIIGRFIDSYVFVDIYVLADSVGFFSIINKELLAAIGAKDMV